MILRFTLDASKIDVVAKREGQAVLVAVGEEQFRMELARASTGVAVVALADGHILKVFFNRGGKGQWQLQCQGRIQEVRLLDPWTQEATARSQQEGLTEVRAPIPGRVVEVVAVPGALIAPGDAIVVLEAMKMQNIITSQRGGVVREVLVSSGQAVDAGHLLALVGQ